MPQFNVAAPFLVNLSEKQGEQSDYQTKLEAQSLNAAKNQITSTVKKQKKSA